MKNPAKYYDGGIIRRVAGAKLLEHVQPFCQFELCDLVAYPNRDSTAYRSRYDIPEARTVQRNTLRYAQFPAIAKALADTGFLQDGDVAYLDPSSKPLAWREVTCNVTNASSSSETYRLQTSANMTPLTETRDLTTAITSRTSFESVQAKQEVIDGLKWIGLYSDHRAVQRGNPLDTVCGLLEEKLKYEAGERDMVILQHHFEIEHCNGDLVCNSKRTCQAHGTDTVQETRYVSMTDFGDPNGHSALAKLVGVTCAVAVKKVLDGSILETGVVAPVKWEMVEPLIGELEPRGIRAHVERSILPKDIKSPASIEVNSIKVA